MGNKSNPQVEIKKIVVEMQDVQACFPGSIIQRGQSNYVRLDQGFMHFWELMAGDELLITVTRVKREIRKGE